MYELYELAIEVFILLWITRSARYQFFYFYLSVQESPLSSVEVFLQLDFRAGVSEVFLQAI